MKSLLLMVLFFWVWALFVAAETLRPVLRRDFDLFYDGIGRERWLWGLLGKTNGRFQIARYRMPKRN